MAMRLAKEIANFLKSSDISIEELIEEVKRAQKEPKLHQYYIGFSYIAYDGETFLAENETQAVEKFHQAYGDNYVIREISEEGEVEDY